MLVGVLVGTFNPKRLERAIQAKGLTAADLAYEMRRTSGGRLKTTESQVYKWLRGDHVPTIGALAVAARATDVTTDSLFEHDEDDEEKARAMRLNRIRVELARTGRTDLVADLNALAGAGAGATDGWL
jgi:transcriptional regulator with XRE-family HTH domain